MWGKDVEGKGSGVSEPMAGISEHLEIVRFYSTNVNLCSIGYYGRWQEAPQKETEEIVEPSEQRTS